MTKEDKKAKTNDMELVGVVQNLNEDKANIATTKMPLSVIVVISLLKNLFRLIKTN
ncbi:hypothetical protein [Algoriphagus chordae]|uniref:Uncharacterized protein n=1 Tax=Algoriphagus chordae TaxID=237019 RepID=A0A2W7R1Z0_9BACT|nr:hypothetical protein [Algoriphagus chordae]PZX54191.1 hypothetical protein LV85_01531 [Algoriphagus chordae]